MLISIALRRTLTALPMTVIASCVAAVAILPVIHSYHPRTSEEMKPALAYLEAHHRSSDHLYVSAQAQYAFAYYHECKCSTFDPHKVWPFTTSSRAEERRAAVESRSPRLIIEANPPTPDGLPDVAKPLIGGRVWFMFADTPDEQKRLLLTYFDEISTRIQEFHASGPSEVATSLYLYDLRSTARDPATPPRTR